MIKCKEVYKHILSEKGYNVLAKEKDVRGTWKENLLRLLWFESIDEFVNL